MSTPTDARARRARWACVYGTLAIVAAYVGVIAHLGHPVIPGSVGLALVGVLTWVAVQEALERQQPRGAQSPSAPMSITKR